MLKKTALFDLHTQAGAKIVPFAGWEMPIHYGSQVNEHHVVRQDAGMFDVSHMTIVDIKGDDAESFLRHLLANDVARLDVIGRALYTCMLNEKGGVVDDLIVYKLGDNFFRLVVNAGTRDKDIAWLEKQIKSFNATMTEQSSLAMIAVQGPNAIDKTLAVLSDSLREKASTLKPFHAALADGWLVANTGYTGEAGFEILLPESEAPALWRALFSEGVQPCGLGARDTLRLEAGLNLYGQDMDDTISPLEANLAWTVAFDPEDRDFIGRSALSNQRDSGIARELVGLVLEGKGVLRRGQTVLIEGVGEGVITSGTFSPTLSKGIGLALVPPTNKLRCAVDMRGKAINAFIVKPSFVRKGKVAKAITEL